MAATVPSPRSEVGSAGAVSLPLRMPIPRTPIQAVFVTEFDVHHGNGVRFQYPPQVDLPLIEFLSIPSGLHTVPEDIIYFTVGDLYGVSCYETVRVYGQQASAVRGAKMVAVGAVGRRAEDLRHWIPHFKRLLSYVPIDSMPRQLEALFTAQLTRVVKPKPSYAHRSPPSTNAIQQQNELNVEFHLNQLASHCGPAIYILWKSLLLRRRILISTQPPVHLACQYVHALHRLGCQLESYMLTSDTTQLSKQRALYCVSVNNMDQLKSCASFVACSTDRIIETKQQYYDLLIRLSHADGQPALRVAPQQVPKSPIGQVNSFDRRRFKRDLERHFSEASDVGQGWASHASFDGPKAGPDSAMAAVGPNERFLSSSVGRTSMDQFRRLSRKVTSYHDLKRNSMGSASSLFSERTLLTCSGQAFSVLEYFESITTNLLVKLQSILQRSFDKASARSPQYLVLKAKHLISLGLHPYYDGEFVEQLAQVYFANFPPVKVKRTMLPGYSFLLWDAAKGSLNTNMCACNHACLKCQPELETTGELESLLPRIEYQAGRLSIDSR
ncbi:hypothetical protein H4R35_000181 [Dimargaris xerosporica]|nr:hypothetical protein H4R35_000181 [Dimargaris xerosporica]